MHEIKIGDRSFVLDDPNGALARVEKHEQVIAHPDSGSMEATVREAKERKLQAELFAKTVFPLANDRPHMKILENLLKGRIGRPGIVLLWIVTGIPCLMMAWGFFSLFMAHIHDVRVPSGLTARICGLVGIEAIFAWWIGLLLRATFAAFSRRRADR